MNYQNPQNPPAAWTNSRSLTDCWKTSPARQIVDWVIRRLQWEWLLRCTIAPMPGFVEYGVEWTAVFRRHSLRVDVNWKSSISILLGVCFEALPSAITGFLSILIYIFHYQLLSDNGASLLLCTVPILFLREPFPRHGSILYPRFCANEYILPQ